MFTSARNRASRNGLVVALSLGLVVTGSALATGSLSPSGGVARGAKGGARGRQSYATVPLAFAANRGQAPAGVGFVAATKGFSLSVSPTGALLGLAARPSSDAAAPAPRSTALRMSLVGANPHARATQEQPLPGTVNYLVSSDRARWRTNVPTFARVAYKGVYPGIDVAYHGDQGQMEYDFVVAPGADPAAISLAFDGAEGVRLDGGDLVVATAGGDVRHHAPRLYQKVGGTRRPIDGQFVLYGDHVGFEVGSYDHAAALVIDPKLAYSTYVGGPGDDSTTGIAVDGTGSAYVVGSTPSITTTTGAFQPNAPGNGDIFVAKLNPSGSAFAYVTYLGGSGYDGGTGIAVDGAGDAYVVGDTSSTDFPTANAYQAAPAGGGDGVVAKLNPGGSGLLYSTYLGGAGDDHLSAVAVGAAGAAFVTGYSGSTNFPTRSGVVQDSLRDGIDVVVAKIDTTASGDTSLVYGTYLGTPVDGNGPYNEGGLGIDVDQAGAAYVGGFTTSFDFPHTLRTFDLPAYPGTRGFIAKFDPTASTLVYSVLLGGAQHGKWGYPARTAVSDLAVDASGAAHVTGSTGQPDFPTTAGAYQRTFAGGNGGCCSDGTDAFMTKVSPAGDSLLYSTFLGGGGDETAYSIALGPAGRVYLTGGTLSGKVFTPRFPLVRPIDSMCSCDSIGGYPFPTDAFVSVLNPGGNQAADLVFSTYVGASGLDSGWGIASDAAGNAYVAGTTEPGSPGHSGIGSPRFFTTPRAAQTRPGGGQDGWVIKITGI